MNTLMLPSSLRHAFLLKSFSEDPLLVSQSLLPFNLSHQPGRARDEELHQQHPGEAANEHPVSIEPGQGDRGEEGDPDEDDVGQVKVTVILISLCHRVGHHSENIVEQFMYHDCFEKIDGDNADEMRDQDEKEKLLSSLLLVDVKISNLRFVS